jgi:hypothetical protein
MTAGQNVARSRVAAGEPFNFGGRWSALEVIGIPPLGAHLRLRLGASQRTVAATVVSIVGAREEGARCKAGASPSLRLLQLTTNEGGTSKRIK